MIDVILVFDFNEFVIYIEFLKLEFCVFIGFMSFE